MGILETVGFACLDVAARKSRPDEVTSARVASIAGRALSKPETVTLEEIRILAGSALTQARSRRD